MAQYYNKNRCIKSVLAGVLLAFSVNTMADIPQGINYQSTLRNAYGGAIKGTPAYIKVSIIKGDEDGSINNGDIVYQETQSAMTDMAGVISFQIGTGTVVSGNVSDIDWSSGIYFIKTETSLSKDMTDPVIGISQFQSVPYAFRAKYADNVFSGKYEDLTNTPDLSVLSEKTEVTKQIADSLANIRWEMDVNNLVSKSADGYLNNRIDSLSKVSKESHAELAEKITDTKTDLTNDIATTKSELSDDITALESSLTKEIADTKTDLTNDIATAKSELSDDITALETSLTKEIADTKTDLTGDIATAKSELSDDITALEASLTKEIADTKTDLTNDIATAKSELSDDITALETSLTKKIADTKTDLAGDIATAKSELSDDITALETSLTKKIADTKTDLAGDIATAKSELSDDIEALETSLNGKIVETKTALSDDIDAAKTELTLDINSLNGTLTEKINNTKKDLTASISSIQTDVVTAQEDISDLQDEISKLNKSVKGIDDIKTDVEDLKENTITKTKFDTEVDKIYDHISKQDQGIYSQTEQLWQNFNSYVHKSEFEGRLAGLTIGGSGGAADIEAALSNYALKSDLATCAAKSDLDDLNDRVTLLEGSTGTGTGNVDLSDYVTSTDLTTTLSSYVKKSELSDYAKSEDLPDMTKYVKSATLNTTLSSYAKQADLEELSDRVDALGTGNGTIELEGYAKKSELTDYAKKSDLPNMTTYAKKSDLPDLTGYVESSTLEDYAKTADLPSTYALKSDLETLKTQVAALGTGTGTGADLTPYLTIEDAENTYLKKTDLPNITGYVTESDYNTKVAELEEEINKLKTRVSELENGTGTGTGTTDLTDINNAISALDSRLSAAETDIETAKTDASAAKATAQTAENKANRAMTLAGEVLDDVADLKATVNGSGTGGGTDGLVYKVKTLEQTVGPLGTSISSNIGLYDQNSLTDFVAAYESGYEFYKSYMNIVVYAIIKSIKENGDLSGVAGIINTEIPSSPGTGN